jgi:hypothetical protein
MVALVLSQITLVGDAVTRTRVEEAARDLLYTYLFNFHANEALSPRMRGYLHRSLFEAHTIRFYDIYERPEPYTIHQGAIPLSRESVRLPDGRSTYHRERRLSVVIISECWKPFPCFIIINIMEYTSPRGKTTPSTNDIQGGGFSGMLMFLGALMLNVDISCHAWERVLEKIETNFSVTVSTEA